MMWESTPRTSFFVYYSVFVLSLKLCCRISQSFEIAVGVDRRRLAVTYSVRNLGHISTIPWIGNDKVNSECDNLRHLSIIIKYTRIIVWFIHNRVRSVRLDPYITENAPCGRPSPVTESSILSDNCCAKEKVSKRGNFLQFYAVQVVSFDPIRWCSCWIYCPSNGIIRYRTTWFIT